MADRTISERLQPSLLDRLTDLEPEKTMEGRNARVIDVNRLRDIIRRDLSWLLNSNNLETAIDARKYPQAALSTLNYGVREVSGDFATLARAQDIRKSIQTSIRHFEPRINEGTLEVVLRNVQETKRAVVVFDIKAEMWAEPYPLELYLRSEVDLTTGQVELAEQR